MVDITDCASNVSGLHLTPAYEWVHFALYSYLLCARSLGIRIDEMGRRLYR